MDPTPGFPAKEVLGVKDIASRDWSGRVWASLPLSQTVFFEGSDQTWVVGDVRFTTPFVRLPRTNCRNRPQNPQRQAYRMQELVGPRNSPPNPFDLLFPPE